MQWIPVILAAFSFLSVIFNKLYSKEAEAQQADAEFQIREAARMLAVQTQIALQQSQAPSVTAGAANAWDAADGAIQGP